MMDRKKEWRQYIEAAWSEFATSPSQHLSQEVLLEYQRGRLKHPAGEKIESHLAECAQCLETLVEMSDFLRSVVGEKETTNATASDPHFQTFWQRLHSEEPPTSDALSQKRVGFLGNRPAMFALAASLLLAFALTGVWAISLWRENQQLTQLQPGQRNLVNELKELKGENLSLQEQITTLNQRQEALKEENRRLQAHITDTEQRYGTQLAQLTQPDVNVPVKDIYPREDIQRSADNRVVNRIRVPRGTRSFTLILWDYQPGFQEYSYQIIDRSGDVVWKGEGLRPNESGSLTLKLDRASLSEKGYTLSLYGQKKLVAEYVLLIE